MPPRERQRPDGRLDRVSSFGVTILKNGNNTHTERHLRASLMAAARPDRAGPDH